MKRIPVLFSVCTLLFSYLSSAQVRLQTGSAEYSIPVYSFSDKNSGLSTSVSLNYSSENGLKVPDVASNVGTGWAIIAGGFIQRIQIGEPDDQNSLAQFPKAPINCNIIGFNHSIALEADESEASVNYINNYYPNGFLYSEFEPMNENDYLVDLTPSNCNVPRELALSPRFKSSMDKRWKQSRRVLADREQDIFIFSFNGRTGQFVIGRDGQITVMPDSKIRIKAIGGSVLAGPGIRTTITGFEITDEMGVQYTFNDYEKAEVANINSVSNSSNLSISEAVGSGNYVISKWNLSSIQNLSVKGEIQFSYEDETVWRPYNYSSDFQITEGGSANGSVGILHDLAKAVIKRLKSIELPDKTTRVDFVYKEHSRYDLAGSAPLQDIMIKYGEEITKRFHFETGYFVKKEIHNLTNVSEEDRIYSRLALKSVQETGGADKLSIPPYLFEYYTGAESSDELDIVPPQFTFAQDMWGYYNKSLGLLNMADIGSQFAVLKNLHTNQRPIDENTAKNGLLRSIRTPLGGKLIYEYEQNKYYDTDHEIAVGGVRVNRTILNDDATQDNDIITEYQYTKADGTSSLWGYEAPVNSSTRVLRIMNAAPGYDYDQPGNQIVNTIGSVASCVTSAYLTNVGKWLFAKGYKLKGFDGVAAEAAFYYVLFNYVVPAVITLLDPYNEYPYREYAYYPKWYSNPLPMQYSRVSVRNSNRRDKIINEFRSPQSPLSSLSFPFSSRTRIASWEYGQPTSIKYLNNDEKKVKEVNYSYSVATVSYPSDINNRSVKIEPNRMYSARCEYYTYTIPVTDFSYDFYTPVTGHSQLSQVEEILYNPETDKSITKAIYYEYNENIFLVSKITEIKSDGGKKNTRIYYPCDYNKEIVKQADDMLKDHMDGVPMSIEEWQTNVNGGGWEMTGATATEFEMLPNLDYRPTKIYSFLNNEPVPEGGIGVFDKNKLVRDILLIPLSLSVGYNIYGDPVDEFENQSKRKTCKIFDKINHLLIAEVTNAKFNEVAYTSFENGQADGWTVGGTGSIVTGSAIQAVTGANYVLGGNYIISTPPVTVTNNNYKLSFWATDPEPTVRNPANNSSFSPTIGGPVINGWKYYEYNLDLPPGNAIVQISGKDKIDEIRLYPSKARMKTINYYPPYGKTSECDENNHIQYYEYDDLGRLKMIKDQNRDIIKTYEYHYKYDE